jgi:hypothetical protein
MLVPPLESIGEVSLATGVATTTSASPASPMTIDAKCQREPLCQIHPVGDQCALPEPEGSATRRVGPPLDEEPRTARLQVVREESCQVAFVLDWKTNATGAWTPLDANTVHTHTQERANKSSTIGSSDPPRPYLRIGQIEGSAVSLYRSRNGGFPPRGPHSTLFAYTAEWQRDGFCPNSRTNARSR